MVVAGRTISDVGEFGLIELITRWIGDGGSSRVIVGPGDDAAVLRPPAGKPANKIINGNKILSSF